MKIIAFGASYSKNSINKQFATYATSFFEPQDVEVLELNDYPLPLFTIDLERETGHHPVAKGFVEKIDEADLLIISLSEHNGSYATAFKNLFDWASRFKVKMFENKKVLLLATAPGPRGGLSVLETAEKRFPIHGAEIIGTFSLPKFADNFLDGQGITDTELKSRFEEVVHLAKETLKTRQ